MSKINLECLQLNVNWLGKTGKELKKEIDKLLDTIQAIDRNLICSREHAIGVLLSFASNQKTDFIEFVKSI